MIRKLWHWIRHRTTETDTEATNACMDCEREELRQWLEDKRHIVRRLETMADSMRPPRPKEHHHGS